MKKIIINTLVCTALFFGLISCSSDVKYDYDRSPMDLVYFKPLSNIVNEYDVAKYSVIHTPIGSSTDLNFKIPINIVIAPSNDISANISVDNSLVNKYNKEYSKSYMEVPRDMITIENEKLTIVAGETESKDSVSVSLDNSKLNQLEEGDYLIPIVISSASGTKVSSNRNKTFLLVNVSKVYIWDNGNPYGTLVSTNRPTWTINMIPAPKSAFGKQEKVFDGVVGRGWTDSWYCNFAEPTTIIIDMKEEQKNITGFYLKNMVINSQLSYSSDNQNWTRLGQVKKSSPEVVLYEPIHARYIRWEIPVAGSMYLDLFEISIYQK